MSNEVVKKNYSVTLDWTDVSGANKYHLQVSTTPDFDDPFVDSNILTLSTNTFIDVANNDLTFEASRRYWRWRSSSDSGSTWASWSQVASYWFDSGLGADVSLSDNTWAIINPSNTTDRYTFETFPIFHVAPAMINRLRQRNRQGTMMSEYITSKDSVILSFDQSCYLTREQFTELTRFHQQIKTFLIACSVWNGRDYVPNCWLVQFQSDPSFTMMTAGRMDLMIGEVTMEEI